MGMFSDLNPPDRPRKQLRDNLAALGTPPAHIDAIVDIACQAADNAFRSATRTVDLLSDDREKVTAIGLVFSLVASDAERTIDGLREFATMAGMKTGQFSMTTGGQANG